ncbi:MAG: phosphoenolpyruvate hydrolase family protein [Candidatus Bathyarchaeia archaeon]|nr:phosphoenolpyruvate hydrolase family protein [Candidatus Bathyarchaeota archaeon]
MAKRYSKTEVLERLNKEIDRGKPIVMAGAGIGIAAKFIERGGADIIGVYNSGYYRMHGWGSLAGMLPMGDANGLVYEMGAREILPVVRETPVIAGLNGTDVTRDMGIFLRQIKEIGFSGIHNFPTISWFSGEFRETLEATGFTYQMEIEMLKMANELDMLTIGYAFNAEETERLIREGDVDVYIYHAGITRGGSTGVAKTLTLKEMAEKTQRFYDIVKRIKPETILLAHGAALASPEDAEYILSNTDAVGVQLGSAIERLAVEEPLRQRTQAFKNINVKIRREK